MAQMSSRERVMRTLRCEEPDRVPFLEVAIDESVARTTAELER